MARKRHSDKDILKLLRELAAITAEVMDEVLQELPARVRPDPDTVKGLVGVDTDCI